MMSALLCLGYTIIGFIIAGFRIANVLQMSKYIDNFENDVIGGETKFIEMILKTILLWPIVVIICLVNNRRG